MTRRERRAHDRAWDRAYNRAVNDGTLELSIRLPFSILETEAERLTTTEAFRRGMARAFKGVTRA